MKKLLLIAVLAFACVGMNAQDGLEGTWFAGGQLSFGSTKNASTKTTSTTVLPIVGKFINPSVAIGLGVGYIGEKEKQSEGDKEQIGKSNKFVIKPLARKYWNISGGLHFFGQAALPVQIGSSEGAKGSVKTNTQSFAFELAPGLDYIVNDWFSIETSFSIFNVGYSNSKPKGGKSNSSFGFDANPFNSMSDREVGKLQIGAKFLF